jgi:hypothetical protein
MRVKNAKLEPQIVPQIGHCLPSAEWAGIPLVLAYRNNYAIVMDLL